MGRGGGGEAVRSMDATPRPKTRSTRIMASQCIKKTCEKTAIRTWRVSFFIFVLCSAATEWPSDGLSGDSGPALVGISHHGNGRLRSFVCYRSMTTSSWPNSRRRKTDQCPRTAKAHLYWLFYTILILASGRPPHRSSFILVQQGTRGCKSKVQSAP